MAEDIDPTSATEEMLTNATEMATTPKPEGIDYEKMGKMMSFTFGAVFFIIILLLLDLYDKRYSAYVKEKLFNRSKDKNPPKAAKDGPPDATGETDEDAKQPLQECRPSTSTSTC